MSTRVTRSGMCFSLCYKLFFLQLPYLAKELNASGKLTRSKTAVLPKPSVTASVKAKSKASRKSTPPPPSSSPARLSASEEKALSVLKKKQRDAQLQALKDRKEGKFFFFVGISSY